MHEMESKVADHLVEMNEHFDLVAVKAEFETQRMQPHELQRLVTISRSANLGVALKVGGPEALTDVDLGLLSELYGFIFPMVETGFALEKSLEGVKECVSLGQRSGLTIAANVETITACKNIEDILDVAKAGGLDAVTLGRVDLTRSMKLGRDAINSDQVYKLAHRVCKMVKAAGLEMTVGGGVEAESFDFISRLIALGILDRFETRMIVFSSHVANDRETYERAVKMAHKFEKLWSDYWAYKYESQAQQHRKRRDMLKKRIGEE